MGDNVFKGFEQLLELAKYLEEKKESGELKTDFHFSTNRMSSMPPREGYQRQGGFSSEGFSESYRKKKDDFTSKFSGKEDTGDFQNNTGSSLEDDQPLGEKVGGMQQELKELQEMVGIPLKRPELLKRLGLEPPRGVLMVGPPGTGKTLTARTLAKELDVNYIAIAGPEMIGKYYGEAENRIRDLFKKAAQRKPCIIFIDEIDSLAPDRSKVEGEVEKRVVAQLLSLMDGFAASDGVIVLAATNRPNHIDPALRRPGRFDREVTFRVPNRAGRKQILEIMTKEMPLENVSLEDLANQSVGFVGADLKALCQKAAYQALRRSVPDLTTPEPDKMKVTATDFAEAMVAIKPAVLRSVAVETPTIQWDEVGGLQEVKHTLKESVEGALKFPELYARTGAKAPKGILLYGPPGTGKTLLAKAVASQANANFIAVNGPELLSKWIGASEEAIREVFAKARQASPCVIFIDEVDTLAPARGSNQNDSGVSDRLVGQLLTEMDGLREGNQLLVICATNRPEVLDSAMLRAGRLDIQLEIGLPDVESRESILQVHNAERPLKGVNLKELAQKTEGWNGADLALLCNQAALQAVKRYRLQGMADPDSLQVEAQDFYEALQMLMLQHRSNTTP